jgi:sulfide:quinone oxidoreductase
MTKNILILGAGFGGLESALSLGTLLNEKYSITLIDKPDSFFIGFSKFDILFGRKSEMEIKYFYHDLDSEKISFVQDEIVQIDIENNRVRTTGSLFEYDYLIVSLGADLDYNAIKGFVESGQNEFYSLEGAKKLKNTLQDFSNGIVSVCIFRNPYKCPPAPFEGVMQLHDYFIERGIRNDVDLKIVVPMPVPLPVSQQASEKVTDLLRERNIELITNMQISQIDFRNQRLQSTGDQEIPYDLLIGIPVHVPPEVVQQSSLSNNGFIEVSNETLETRFNNVYAIGDVAQVQFGEGKQVPKAGALAEDAAKTVVQEILKKEGFVRNSRKFEATGICFLEFGRGNVARLNANFLGGDKPVGKLEGPSQEGQNAKIEFERIRKEKWFKQI